MKQFVLFILLLSASACQEPHFNTPQASAADISQARAADVSQSRCPVRLTAFKNCIEEELFDFVDDYQRSKNKKRDKIELAEDLLSKHLFQYCGESLLEKLKDLEESEKSQCKNAALIESLLTFLDQLTLDITLKVIRNDTFH